MELSSLIWDLYMAHIRGVDSDFVHDDHGDIDNDNRATGYDDHNGADKAWMSVAFTRTLTLLRHVKRLCS